MEALRDQHSGIWELVHASRYAELAPILATLIPGLETAIRTADSEHVQAEAREMLGDTYQAAAAMMVKIGETDAAWIAADRAGFCAEAAGSPLAVAASMFRMAHVFLALSQIDQAHHVAVDPTSLSPERQARYLLDLAQAHAMRRQIGEALHAPGGREHRPGRNPRPLRRPRRSPRPAPALRPAPTT
jgi:hypothetical protein